MTKNGKAVRIAAAHEIDTASVLRRVVEFRLKDLDDEGLSVVQAVLDCVQLDCPNSRTHRHGEDFILSVLRHYREQGLLFPEDVQGLLDQTSRPTLVWRCEAATRTRQHSKRIPRKLKNALVEFASQPLAATGDAS